MAGSGSNEHQATCEFVLMPRVHSACHTQEVSFQEGEGESQQDMRVYGEG